MMVSRYRFWNTQTYIHPFTTTLCPQNGTGDLMEIAVCFTSAICFKLKAESRLPLDGANIIGFHLYNEVSDCFIRHIQGMLQVSICLILSKSANWSNPQKTKVLEDVDLLRYYASEWDRYTRGANYVNRLFTFLNRNWVLYERREGNNRILQVYSVRYCLLFITFHLIDSNI